MSDVTDLLDQIYLKQGFSGLEIFKEMHAVWNFQLLVGGSKAKNLSLKGDLAYLIGSNRIARGFCLFVFLFIYLFFVSSLHTTWFVNYGRFFFSKNPRYFAVCPMKWLKGNVQSD